MTGLPVDRPAKGCRPEPCARVLGLEDRLAGDPAWIFLALREELGARRPRASGGIVDRREPGIGEKLRRRFRLKKMSCDELGAMRLAVGGQDRRDGHRAV